LVEELRAAAGDGDSTGHEDRLAYVQHRHPTIHTAYHILQNASMLARYESNSTFFAQFQRESIKERLVGQYLSEIERYVKKPTEASKSTPAHGAPVAQAAK
jgi:hypothetical protein